MPKINKTKLKLIVYYRIIPLKIYATDKEIIRYNPHLIAMNRAKYKPVSIPLKIIIITRNEFIKINDTNSFLLLFLRSQLTNED